ncbi:tyrosine-type recombinase/integrase [Thalassotalea litorea]|uniref:tyrosine-type recombinase/integrase n=1 Tax=Thalassotalea litorea TaxID=2020715 RepID=UPI00373634E9
MLSEFPNKNMNANEVVANFAATPDLKLSMTEIKLLKKCLNIKHLEAHGAGFRFVRKFVKYRPQPFKFSVRGGFTYQGILVAKADAEELKRLSYDQLLDKELLVSSIYFGQVIDEYNNFDGSGLEENTTKTYERDCKRLYKAFGTFLIQDINHNLVEEWVYSSKLDADGIQEVLRHLGKILDLALRQGYLRKHNIDINDLRLKVRRKDIRSNNGLTHHSQEEVNCLASLDPKIVSSHGLTAVWAMENLRTKNSGSRVGEAISMATADFSYVGKQLKGNVRRSKSNNYYKTPKIAKGDVSSFDILPSNKKWLDMLVKDSDQYMEHEIEIFEKRQLVRKEQVKFLMNNPKTGLPYTEQQYRRAVKKLQALAGISNVLPPRNSRTTFATNSCEMGVSETMVANQLTHASAQTTKTHYIKAKHKNTEDEINRADKALVKATGRSQREVITTRTREVVKKLFSGLLSQDESSYENSEFEKFARNKFSRARALAGANIRRI